MKTEQELFFFFNNSDFTKIAATVPLCNGVDNFYCILSFDSEYETWGMKAWTKASKRHHFHRIFSCCTFLWYHESFGHNDDFNFISISNFSNFNLNFNFKLNCSFYHSWNRSPAMFISSGSSLTRRSSEWLLPKHQTQVPYLQRKGFSQKPYIELSQMCRAPYLTSFSSVFEEYYLYIRNLVRVSFRYKLVWY